MKPYLSILASINILSVYIKHICTFYRVTEGSADTGSAKTQIAQVVTIIAVLMILWPSTALATSIVVLRTPTTITIAADSLARYRDGRTMIVCKIYRAGDMSFAASGVVINPDTGFSLPQIIAAELQKNKNINDAIATIEQRAKEALLVELTRMRREKPEEFEEQFMRDDRIAAQFVVAQFVNAVPTVLLREFRTSIENDIINLTPGGTGCPGDCTKSPIYYLLGKHAAIDRVLLTGRLPAGQSVDSPKMRVQLEIDDPIEGKFVRGPIDILRMTCKNTEWIQRKEQCPKIDNTPNCSLAKPKINNSTRGKTRHKLLKAFWKRN